MKRKNIGTLIFLIILTVVLLAVLFWCTFKLLNKTTNQAEQFLSVLGIAISFISTMILGIIAYWQTRTANYISELMIKKETELNFNFLPSVELKCCNLNMSNVLQFAETNPTEGVFCSEEVYNYEETRKYIEFSIPFEIVNGIFEKMQVSNVAFNKTLKESSNFIGLKILNNKDLVLSYNPKSKSYLLKLYICCDFNRLLEINKKKMLVMDIDFSLKNNYQVEQKYVLQINFNSISRLKQLINETVGFLFSLVCRLIDFSQNRYLGNIVGCRSLN